MLNFEKTILRLEKTYVWQGAVLDMAVKYHSDLTYEGVTDSRRWVSPSSKPWIPNQRYPTNAAVQIQLPPLEIKSVLIGTMASLA